MRGKNVYLNFLALLTLLGCGGNDSVISDTAPPELLGFRNELVLPQGTQYTFLANDPSKPISFTLLDNPQNLLFDNGTITIPQDSAGSEYHINLRVADSRGNHIDKNVTIYSVLPSDPTIPLTFSLEDSANRYAWQDAVKMCQQKGAGWSLPTIWQLQKNSQTVYDLVKGIDSDLNSQNGDQGFISAVWSINPADELNAGLRAKAWSYNPNVIGEIEDPIKGENKENYFVVCVKKKP